MPKGGVPPGSRKRDKPIQEIKSVVPRCRFRKAKILAQQDADFTAEGAPPGAVARSMHDAAQEFVKAIPRAPTVVLVAHKRWRLDDNL
jgi:hypothetical protein